MRSFFKFSRWIKKSEFLSLSSQSRKPETNSGGFTASRNGDPTTDNPAVERLRKSKKWRMFARQSGRECHTPKDFIFGVKSKTLLECGYRQPDFVRTVINHVEIEPLPHARSVFFCMNALAIRNQMFERIPLLFDCRNGSSGFPEVPRQGLPHLRQ